LQGDGGSDPPPVPPAGTGACGTKFVPSNPKYFAALALDTFKTYQSTWPASICGQCVKVSYAPTGKSVVVPIVDACPGCQNRSPWALDISHQAMADLLGSWDKATNLGIIDISWVVSNCEDHGTYDADSGKPNNPSPPPIPATNAQQQTSLPPYEVNF
jgi:hypothetical protein